jgi:hypothetical protein
MAGTMVLKSVISSTVAEKIKSEIKATIVLKNTVKLYTVQTKNYGGPDPGHRPGPAHSVFVQ